MLLAQDKCSASLMLSFKGIKGLFQTFFGGFPGVDGATNTLPAHVFFWEERQGLLSPKKAGPDHRVWVIWRAITERLL
jgi:hypothetical protein